MLENLRNSVGIRCWEIRPLEGNWVNGEGVIKTEFSWLIAWSPENRASEEKRLFLYRPSATGILLLIGHYNKRECTWWEDRESCKYLLWFIPELVQPGHDWDMVFAFRVLSLAKGPVTDPFLLPCLGTEFQSPSSTIRKRIRLPHGDLPLRVPYRWVQEPKRPYREKSERMKSKNVYWRSPEKQLSLAKSHKPQ